MDIDSDTAKKIQELQISEQNWQAFLMQKQAIQVELSEVLNALSELKKSGDEAYKIIGGIMLKSDKNALSKELEEKKRILDLRISTIEKQERIFEEKAEKLRKDVSNALTRKNN